MLRVGALAALAAAAAAAPLPATNLRTEYVTDPIVLDVASPRFFWQLVSSARGVNQTAFRVVVNSVTGGNATVWDSGVVYSNATTQIAYAGTPLVSDSVYTWTVSWWDNTGAQSPWADWARFGTGLLTQAEWTSGWIGCPLPSAGTPNYNQLRAEFSLDLPAGVTVVHARAYISGLGYYALRVNGEWADQWPGVVDRPRLDPTWTTIEVRSLYNAYDLTRALSTTGPNAFAVFMGNGWPDVDPVPGNSSSGAKVNRAVDPAGKLAAMAGALDPWSRTGFQRRVRMQIHVRTSDGKSTVWTTSADGASPWRCGSGALLDDSVYDGCVWDQRLYTAGWDLPGYKYDAGNWTAAVPVADPGGASKTTMTAQTMQAVRVVQELHPLSVESPAPGVYVFDMGQNFAGIVRLTLQAPLPAGITVQMRHAELLQHTIYGPHDGSIYVGNLRSAKATDLYTTAGTESGVEVFEPMFTYHGFRFVELSGLPPGYTPDLTTITGLYMRSAVDVAGTVAFPDSADVLNQLQRAVSWVMGSNLMSVPSDCPQRDERKGWMGDIGLSIEQSVFNYDLASFLTFWSLNMRDNQVWAGDAHPAGSVSDTVPHTFGSYPADPAWGTAYPAVVYQLWRQYGDTRIAAEHYPNLVAWVTFMQSQVNSTGIGKTYTHYGEWCPPPATPGNGQGPKPPSALISAQAFLTDLQRVVEIATALGNKQDAAYWAGYRATLLAAYNTAFLQGNGVYGNANGDGLQSANAVSAAIGAAGAVGSATFTATVSALVDDIVNKHGGAWAVGIVGMKQLHATLTAGGYGSLAVDNLLRTSYPSYGYMFNNPNEPATTLWELPDGDSEGPGMNSRAHHMFSSVGAWLYKDLAGFRQRDADAPVDPTASGFVHPVVFPKVTSHSALPYLSSTYNALPGRFAVAWQNVSGNACAANVAESGTATLSCASGGLITGVTFASFGTPTGACGAFKTGTCNAANSTSIVTAACVGKPSCSIAVGDALFGDPCYDVVKVFSAQVACSSGAGLSLSVTVPANARATVKIPLVPNAPTAGATVMETGTGTVFPVWKSGAFVPGAPGVLAASLVAPTFPGSGYTVDVEVLGGGLDTPFAFASSQ